MLVKEPLEDRARIADARRGQRATRQQHARGPVDDGQRVTVLAVACLELAFEVRRPDRIRLGHGCKRPPRVSGKSAAPRHGHQALLLQQGSDGTARRQDASTIASRQNSEELLRAPRRMVSAQLAQRLYEIWRRGRRADKRPVRPLG